MSDLATHVEEYRKAGAMLRDYRWSGSEVDALLQQGAMERQAAAEEAIRATKLGSMLMTNLRTEADALDTLKSVRANIDAITEEE